MAWWSLTLIAVFGYVTGFLVSGAVFSHLYSPSWDREDMMGSMIFWPVVLPCYLGQGSMSGSLRGTVTRRK